MRCGLLPLALVGVMTLAACDTVPVASLEKSFTLVVDKSTGDGEPVKIDFLWVIDNSSSMCQEQVGLTDNFDQFTRTIKKFGDFDARVAVASMDVQCDPSDPGINAAKGEFNNRPATSFPPACQTARVKECISDSDCAGLDCEANPSACGGSGGTWVCDKATSALCLVTPNGSLNSKCIRRCTTDTECVDLFGDPRYICHKPSGAQDSWGCMLPPLTKGDTCAQAGEAESACACQGEFCVDRLVGSCPFDFDTSFDGCPDLDRYRTAEFSCCPGDLSTDSARPPCISQTHSDPASCRTESEWKTIATKVCSDQGLSLVEYARDVLPKFLTAGQLGLFSCLATVGVNQKKCFRTEQGMRSAYSALDPTGRNKEQAAAFLRDDAYLVVVFVSDEDDCSAGDNTEVPDKDRHTCSLLKTIDQGGPLVPVGHYVNYFKSLKEDPARVIVAAIAGDAALPKFEDMTDVDKAQFVDPKAPTADEVIAFRDFLREEWVDAKMADQECFHTSYVCESDQGIADWGARYVALTAGFGANGLFQNVCSPEGISQALEEIAGRIVEVISQICLPVAVADGAEANLSVYKWSGICTEDPQCDPGSFCIADDKGARRCRIKLEPGDATTLGDGAYALISGGTECVQKIIFGLPPVSGQEVTIRYQGAADFSQ